MKEVLMPADIYVVLSKMSLEERSRMIITMLYQPIIGLYASNLYFSLWNDLERNDYMSKDFTHHHLMTRMGLSLKEIEEAKEKLEATGLLKSYLRKDITKSYVYELYNPMSSYEFFNHPILNIVLYNNVGKMEYNELINYFKDVKVDLSDYEDITMSFSEVFKARPMSVRENTLENIKKNETGKLKLDFNYDFDLVVSSIPYIDKNKLSNIKELVLSLAFVYNLKELEMANLIGNVTNEKGSIDKDELRKECRKYYQFENGGKLPSLVYRKQPEFLKKPVGEISKKAKMIYTFENLTPYEFLKKKYDGAEPTNSDLKLIEGLMVDQKLNPGVVNVLIDYVLLINNQKLTKAFVETIAGSWKRKGIETVEEAMNVALEEHKKITNKMPVGRGRIKDKMQINPEWFDKTIETEEMSSEDKKELEAILKDFS